jgi:cytochrome c oxidase subunit 2
MPAGKVVKFELRSDNVIHSFWLPKIAGKVDCMPGRANWMWMMADDGKAANDGYDHGPIGADKYEYGLYYGQCAQYCGEAHAFMLFRSRIVSDKDFVAWVEQSQKKVPPPAGADWSKFISAVNPTNGSAPDKAMLATPAERGAAIFFGKRGQCVLCHTIDGTPAQGMKGPNLTRVASRTSLAAGFLDNLANTGGTIDPARQEENFFTWIKDPLSVKPGNLMWYDPALQNGLRKIYQDDKDNGVPMTDNDWHDLAAFLMTLK